MTEDVVPPPRGLLFLVTAPSAAGKDSVLRVLRGRGVDVAWVTTAVTRKPRPQEVDGRDHFFLEHSEFQARRKAGWFLETASVYGRLYGTPIGEVRAPLQEGSDVILRLDVQGARELKRRLSRAIVVFIEPPSVREAERRIRERATESTEEVRQRVQAMHAYEMAFADHADYRLPNPTGELEATAEHLWSIVVAERLRAHVRTVDPNDLKAWTEEPIRP